MSRKGYDQQCARLVQEATGASYSASLWWVREHITAHPARITKEERALKIVEERDAKDAKAAKTRADP